MTSYCTAADLYERKHNRSATGQRKALQTKQNKMKTIEYVVGFAVMGMVRA